MIQASGLKAATGIGLRGAGGHGSGGGERQAGKHGQGQDDAEGSQAKQGQAKEHVSLLCRVGSRGGHPLEIKTQERRKWYGGRALAWLASDCNSLTATKVIIAGSLQGGGCSGTITSDKYSLSSDNTGLLAGPGSVNNTDPLLGPLGSHGGPTQVHLPAADSPAVDGVLGNDAPPSDQRGVARPQGAGFDIGAVERRLEDDIWKVLLTMVVR
jgi:hypothetical protein